VRCVGWKPRLNVSEWSTEDISLSVCVLGDCGERRAGVTNQALLYSTAVRSVRGYTGNGGLPTTSCHVHQANTTTAGSPFKRHSARTGRTVFSQLSAAVYGGHKANVGLVYAIRAWFKYDTALSAVV